ncbi:MAG: hypothetical protein WBB01_06750 [Phormidesmis sp.]
MPLDAILKRLLAVKVPIALGVLGLVLRVGGSNHLLRQAGASVAFMASGASAVCVTQKDARQAELRKLKANHKRRAAILKTSADLAIADVAKAQQRANQQTAIAEQANDTLSQLQLKLTTLKAERDRALATAAAQTTQLTQLSIELTDCQRSHSLIKSQLKRSDSDRLQVIHELYQMTVTEADLAADVVGLETRIAQLEAALTAKTEMATQMLTELEKDAMDTFTQFTGKISAQDKIINSLQQQIQILKETNAALSKQHQRLQSQHARENKVLAR